MSDLNLFIEWPSMVFSQVAQLQMKMILSGASTWNWYKFWMKQRSYENTVHCYFFITYEIEWNKNDLSFWGHHSAHQGFLVSKFLLGLTFRYHALLGDKNTAVSSLNSIWQSCFSLNRGFLRILLLSSLDDLFHIPVNPIPHNPNF